MKKILTVLFLITSATMLYAEAPELKNMMPNSWQKVTRLTEQEEAEFLRKVDLKKYFSDSDYEYYYGGVSGYGGVLLGKEKVYIQIYREKCNSLEIYRVLSSEVPIEEALQLTTITDGIYTAEEEHMIHYGPAILEIDFLKDGDIYKYIASIDYGGPEPIEGTDVFEYGNIMYRARNAEDVGVFITEVLIPLFIKYEVNADSKTIFYEFIFERCKNQLKGRTYNCIYYDNVKALVEWDDDERSDKEIRIHAGDFLIDDTEFPLKYSIQNAFDGNPATSYVENTEDDMIKVEVSAGKEVDKIAIINGYAQNNSLYKSNNRIKTVTDNSGSSAFELKDDRLDYQYVPWEENAVISTDIYKGERYNDTCIAELNFLCGNSWLFGELND